MSKPLKAIAYLRVSTDDQAAKGVSLDAQRAKVEAYAKLYEHEIVAVVEDAGASGKSLDRPGLTRALAMLAAGEATALIVMKLDRLTRSVRDLGELLSQHFAPGKAALLSVGEQIDTRSAAGRLVLNVLTSVAQWEREAIVERTTVALAHKRSRGERVGSIPYGYRVGPDRRKLEPAAVEQAAIILARDLRNDGMSLRRVGEQLACRGYTARNGQPFAPMQVQRMLAA
jgi:site-specific DNA recombinase